VITELLAALAAIPKIADSLDRLAGTVERINARAAKARAASRRTRKDKDVEDRIADLVDAPADGLLEHEVGK
jgi:hypothetical protein